MKIQTAHPPEAWYYRCEILPELYLGCQVETHLCVVDVISAGDLAAAQQTGTDIGVPVSTNRVSTSSVSTTSGSAMAPQMSKTRPPSDSYDPVPFTILADSPDQAVLGTLMSQQSSGRSPHAGNSGVVDDWLEWPHRTSLDEHNSSNQLDRSPLATPISRRNEIEPQLASSMASLSTPPYSEVMGAVTNVATAYKQNTRNLSEQRGGGNMPSPDAFISFPRGGSSTTPASDRAGGPVTCMGLGEGTGGYSSDIEMLYGGRNGSILEHGGAGPQPDSDMLAGHTIPSKPVPIPVRGLANAVQMSTDRMRANNTSDSAGALGLQQAHADLAQASEAAVRGLLQGGIRSAQEPPHALPILSGNHNPQHRGSTVEPLPETASGRSSGSWVRVADANPSPSQVWGRSPDSNDGWGRREQAMTPSHTLTSQVSGPT